MKLLIVTQKVDRDDPILGFFHRWIIEFAKHFEKVSVVCLEQGVYDLPENVKVFSLGKEENKSRLEYLFRFYKYIWSLRKEYDVVFVHMNPEYVVFGWKIWKLLAKKIGLWYTHREKNLKLRIATIFSDIIFTASKESFTLKSKKVRVMGHGIDVAAFACPIYDKPVGQVTLLQVGRITPIKHCENAIEALVMLGDGYRLKFVGNPHTKSDYIYFESLKKLIDEKGISDRVEFSGGMPNRDIAKEYCNVDATLNLTPTGGVDKVVLESMAAGRIVFTSNHTFADYFGSYKSLLLLHDNKPVTIAEAIKKTFDLADLGQMAQDLQKTAIEKASVGALIANISAYLK